MNPWLTPQGLELLEGAVAEMTRETARVAVLEGVGVDPGVRRQRAEAAAAKIAEQVACIHERDLAADFADLPERVGGFLGVSESPATEADLLMAAEECERRDRAMNAIALERFQRVLTEAYCAPVGERRERAEAVLGAERERLVRQARARVPRSVQMLLAAVRLSDEALDVPLGGGL